MTGVPPLQLILGPPDHGVVGYAEDVASALRRIVPDMRIARAGDIPQALDTVRGAPRVHLHVTDRILGGSPERAARNVERLAEVGEVTLTLHDVPQDSDGTMLARRVAAYRRFCAAARGVVVNSHHERHLVAEFLGGGRAHAIALGSRIRVVPNGAVPDSVVSDSPSTVTAGSAARDLTVLMAGFVYPGKGHAQAIRAVADAARLLHDAGESVGRARVRAIGSASAGHERDIEQLRADARSRGVEFEVTGFLGAGEFESRMLVAGIPLAAHQHVSASRSMLDWVEAGRRPLVSASRYATEMAALRPDTLTPYDPNELPGLLADRWMDPGRTWLRPGTPLTPTVDDVAGQYLAWWAES